MALTPLCHSQGVVTCYCAVYAGTEYSVQNRLPPSELTTLRLILCPPPHPLIFTIYCKKATHLSRASFQHLHSLTQNLNRVHIRRQIAYSSYKFDHIQLTPHRLANGSLRKPCRTRSSDRGWKPNGRRPQSSAFPIHHSSGQGCFPPAASLREAMGRDNLTNFSNTCNLRPQVLTVDCEPDRTVARSFSQELMDIFRIENSVADLDEKVDKRFVPPTIFTHTSNRTCWVVRLREMEYGKRLV